MVTDTLGRPIPLASLADEQGRVWAVTDDSGRFRIPGVTGRIGLTVTRIGYRPARLDTLVSRDTAIFVALRLIPLPVTLRAEEISGPGRPNNEALERLGFYQRMRDKRLGTLTATFITPEDLERKTEGLISLALHGVPGIRLRPKNSDATQWLVEGRGGCEMSIWIDWYMVQKGQANNLLSMTGLRDERHAGGRESRVGLDQLVVGTEVLAIEVYPSGVSLPLRFQNINNAGCGALVIWTKR
jgi:hypothetical protein